VGWTPLQTAVFIQRPDVVSYLLSVGANQRHRDNADRNMLHTMLTFPTDDAKTKADKLQEMISCFDKEAVKEMFLERCTLEPGALTPLALWMAKNRGIYKKTDIIEVLSRYSTGEDLTMINGEGDLPLHVAIKQQLSSISSYLITLNPVLLYRENSTGRIPLEMSREIYIASCVADAPAIGSQSCNTYYAGHRDYNSVVHRQASTFVEKDEPEESMKRTWEICEGVDQNGGVDKRRRIASLFEANEVAKRVANMKRESGRGGRQVVINGGLVGSEKKTDAVCEWMN
jgi:hypothetical protein